MTGTNGKAGGLPGSFMRGSTGEPLSPEFFARSAIDVARDLLGQVLVSTVGDALTSGRIVETEAYIGPQDPASHAAARVGRTARNETMFRAPGVAYVYRIYGVHDCVNVVTGRMGFPAAVLIRALEPLEGRESMVARRGRTDHLVSGPGRLCRALGIDRALDGHLLSRDPLRLHAGLRESVARIGVSGRIGISRAADWPLRFFLRASAHLSASRPPPGRRSRPFLEALREVERTLRTE